MFNRPSSSTTGRDRWLVGWALGYAAVGASSLVVPLYAIELGASALFVGLIAATAAFAGAPGAILWGRLAARTKRRRPFVLVALVSAAGVFGILTQVDSPLAVLVANTLLWFVVAAAAPVLNLIVVEGVPADQWDRRFGVLNHYQGYGWLSGLVVGAVWSALAPRVFDLSALAVQRWFLVISAVAAGAGALLVRVWYPDQSTLSATRFARLSAGIRRQSGLIGRSVRAVPYGPSRMYWALQGLDIGDLRSRVGPTLLSYLAAATLFFVGFSVFFGPLPAYLVSSGRTADEVFVLFVLSSLGSAVSYARVGTLTATHDSRQLQVGALATRGLAFPLVAIVGARLTAGTSLVVLGAIFVVVGVTWAIIAVTATGIVTRLAPEQVRGDALGAYTALASLGGGIGSALGGVVADAFGYVVTFVLAGGVVVTALVIVWSSGEKTVRGQLLSVE
ncbi:MFS transporter [Haloferax sp. MBLA0076]|uniref:MFS transporter n=1 Tax=Haloferax litoreum TaxID=2666140 RepID=A0A6A8GKZ4_9EURY|nr:MULTISPECIES: MFS transporter [Haloferax]KAB1194548.1 MFS transporter [Haloferax sp. CBA1148]MRX23122.1 MFS transporter [Haloferax litoreum]